MSDCITRKTGLITDIFQYRIAEHNFLILRFVISVVCSKTNVEVNISHESTAMVVWIYGGV
jgi:hypothetical protein